MPRLIFEGSMRRAALLAGLAAYSFGHAVPPPPAFEVAVVRMYPPGAVVAPGVQGLEQSPDGLRATHVALRGCCSGPVASWMSTALLPAGFAILMGGPDGQVGERLKPTDCKSVTPCELRRFESFPVHH
jgi:hypothetical protein